MFKSSNGYKDWTNIADDEALPMPNPDTGEGIANWEASTGLERKCRELAKLFEIGQEIPLGSCDS